MKKLKAVAGDEQLELNMDDFEADFDPKEYDRRMKVRFDFIQKSTFQKRPSEEFGFRPIATSKNLRVTNMESLCFQSGFKSRWEETDLPLFTSSTWKLSENFYGFDRKLFHIELEFIRSVETVEQIEWANESLELGLSNIFLFVDLRTSLKSSFRKKGSHIFLQNQFIHDEEWNLDEDTLRKSSTEIRWIYPESSQWRSKFFVWLNDELKSLISWNSVPTSAFSVRDDSDENEEIKKPINFPQLLNLQLYLGTFQRRLLQKRCRWRRKARNLRWRVEK